MLKKRGLVTAGLCCCVSVLVYAQTPDRQTPAVEKVCSGLSGAAFGLCNAYCEAQDCDVHNRPSCAQLRKNFAKLTGSPIFPCDPRCGDGKVNQEEEECDDGNNAACDGCSPRCTREFCGDGVVCRPEECESNADCAAGAGSACRNCLCFTPDECDKDAPCAGATTCSTPDGCNGACFFSAAGNTRCFDGEHGCDLPPCTSDADCAPGSACSDTCCGLGCIPLCSAPPVDECDKLSPCDVAAVCTDGVCACFFTAGGTTKCFAGEFGCQNPPCVTDGDCGPGAACSDTCCGLQCAPLCAAGGAAGAGLNGTSTSKAPAAAVAPPVNNNGGSSSSD